MVKSIICICVAAALILCLGGFVSAHEKRIVFSPTEKQETVHEIAELARQLGLPEDNPIIREAQRIWWEENDNTMNAAENADRIEETCSYWAQEDAEMLARLVYCEARGVDSTMEKAAVVWCALNRVDACTGTIGGVITEPYQFAYSSDAPTEYLGQDFVLLAIDVLERWTAEKLGRTDVGRILPKDYLWFSGDGYHNYFRNEYYSNSHWNWSLNNPYVD